MAGGHNIREIVHHLRVVGDAVRSHFTGEPAAEEANWPTAGGDIGEAAWQQEVARLAESQQSLREAVARLPEASLYENIPGKDLTYATELFGIVNHDVYHAGQISLLRKARATSACDRPDPAPAARLRGGRFAFAETAAAEAC